MSHEARHVTCWNCRTVNQVFDQGPPKVQCSGCGTILTAARLPGRMERR